MNPYTGRGNQTPGERILAEAGPTVTIPDAAIVLGISRRHAYNLAETGEIAGIRTIQLGKSVRLPTAELRRVVGADVPA